MAKEYYELYQTNPVSNIPQGISSTATNLLSQKPSKLDEQDTWDTAREVRTNSQATFSYGSLHMDVQVLDDLFEVIYNSSVRTQGVF